MLAVARDGGFGVVAVLSAKRTQVAAIRLRRVYRVGIVDRPDVAKRIVGRRGASRIRRKCRGVEHAVTRRKEVAAGGAALAVAKHFRSCGLSA